MTTYKNEECPSCKSLIYTVEYIGDVWVGICKGCGTMRRMLEQDKKEPDTKLEFTACLEKVTKDFAHFSLWINKGLISPEPLIVCKGAVEELLLRLKPSCIGYNNDCCTIPEILKIVRETK